MARTVGWSTERDVKEAEDHRSHIASERGHAELSDEQLTEPLEAKAA